MDLKYRCGVLGLATEQWKAWSCCGAPWSLPNCTASSTSPRSKKELTMSCNSVQGGHIQKLR